MVNRSDEAMLVVFELCSICYVAVHFDNTTGYPITQLLPSILRTQARL